jgi:thiosulfate/3-mercaptopyruvate sulfurtransferase
MNAQDMPLLVQTGWLQDRLGDQDLRVFDCTVRLEPAPGGVKLTSGRDAWTRTHVPGAGFLDLLGDLSDRTSRFNAMLPPAGQFAEALGAAGVGPGTRVVLYDDAGNMWAARIWWMLRCFGFDAAGVLDGGWRRWTAEGRPVSDAPPAYPPARFDARPRPGLMADKAEVLRSLGREDVLLVNALGPEIHSGAAAPYGRAGRIPGSVNVPAMSLLDPETGAYRPAADLRRAFDAVGALDGRKVVAYCGGGIAACSDALALTALGAGDVAVYDGSLTEWIADPDTPLETDVPAA